MVKGIKTENQLIHKQKEKNHGKDGKECCVGFFMET